MGMRIADAEFRRWFLRPALVAVAGVLAIAVAIAINLLQSRDDDAVQTIGAPPQVAPLPPLSIDEAARPAAALPSFDVVRINPQGDTVIAGRAEPGATVIVESDDTALGEVTADARGEWVFLPETPLPAGSHRLQLRARGGDGDETVSPDEVLVVVPAPGEDIAGRPAAATSQPLALRVPRSGGPASILQKPVVDGAETTLAIDAVDYAEGRVALSGHAPAGARVRLTIDGKPLGEAVADEAGRWRLVPRGGVSAEQHALSVDQLDGRGAVVARVAVPLALQGLRAAQPSERRVVIERGQNLWRIARSTYGRGTAYTLIYDANRGHITDPDRIYPGQVFRLPGRTGEAARD